MNRIAQCLLISTTAFTTIGAWADYPPAVPAELELTVRETAGVARTAEVLRSGVPLPRSLDIRDVTGLAVVDAAGTPVPAEFRVLARWHAAKSDSSAPIQWLLVAFSSSVSANGSEAYRLVLDGAAGPNPPPATPLQVTRVGDEVTVDTGEARFVVGGSHSALFDQIARTGGPTLSLGGALSGRAEATAMSHPTQRDVRVEHSGPLSAVVVIEGAYDLPAVGGAGLGSSRRYVFTAGSPVAMVRHAVAWEGQLCAWDQLSCSGTPNAVLVEELRDSLAPSLGAAPWTVRAVGERSAGILSGTVNAGETAHVRQHLRADHLDALSFDLAIPGGAASGAEADGALLALDGAGGTLALAGARMHRYEPQALRLAADGSLAFHLADDSVWLGPRQGLFATFSVGAYPPGTTDATLAARSWAALNHPLRAWPRAAWFAASEAVDEIPVGTLPAELTDYDTLLAGALDATLQGIDDTGIAGLMTFGLYPRIWGNPIFTDEIDCEDQTPGQRWDNKYWCATWSDYHNAVATAPIWAMRSGETEWLDELAEPGALRMLHTQILQCGPGDGLFYCGQAPAGYGAYRSNNNGSHAYLDNLLLHYWLTGDETVVRTLERGARSMRGFMCPGRGTLPPGPVCGPSVLPVDDWASLNGRSAVQWYEVFRFLGLASDDSSYLDDWSSGTARWLTLYYAQPEAASVSHGLTSAFNGSLTTDWVSGPGTYDSDQLWMASLYDFNLLHRLGLDSEDAALGAPAVTPSEVVVAWGRVLETTAGLFPWSDGGPAAPWPNSLLYTFSGPRIGGALDVLTADIDGDGDGVPCEICGDDDGGQCFDLCLYDTGKAPLSGTLMRAADLAADDDLRSLGEAFTLFTLERASADPQPLNKLTAEYLTLLHPAVARMAGSAAVPLFADGFESGDTQGWTLAVP